MAYTDNLVTEVRYTYSCSNAMYQFLKNGDIDKLITKLKSIEQIILDKDLEENGYDEECYEKGLWFKFGKQYCLATTIGDIETDLSNMCNNRKFIIDHFELITEDLDPDKALRVYFS